MKRIAKISIWVLLATVLLPVSTSAQSRRDKEQTYVLEQPYEVTRIVSPQGKKIKNVVLMIGDGMSLMHVYSAWTANRGKLFLEFWKTFVCALYKGLWKNYPILR